MRRAFVMPVSAAVVGALLAVGVTALNRSDRYEVHLSHDVDVADAVDVQEIVDIQAEVLRELAEVREVESRVERDVVRTILRDVRNELRVAVENGDRELTDAEREQLRRAMERLDARLPLDLGLSELIDGITKEDGSAHKDAVAADAPVAPDAPAVPDAPAPPDGSSGN